MKFFIILALVAITAAKWEMKTEEDWSTIRNNCDDTFQGRREIKETNKNDKYPSKEVFQLIQCYFRGLEIWNDSDGFLVDRIMIGLESVKHKIADYNENVLRAGWVSCSDTNNEGSSALDWGYRCFKCILDNEYLSASLMKSTFYKNMKAEIKV